MRLLKHNLDYHNIFVDDLSYYFMIEWNVQQLTIKLYHSVLQKGIPPSW